VETGLQKKMIRELLDFQKSMEELRLLRMVSQDLRKIKKMMPLKKFDYPRHSRFSSGKYLWLKENKRNFEVFELS